MTIDYSGYRITTFCSFNNFVKFFSRYLLEENKSIYTYLELGGGMVIIDWLESKMFIENDAEMTRTCYSLKWTAWQDSDIRTFKEYCDFMMREATNEVMTIVSRGLQNA